MVRFARLPLSPYQRDIWVAAAQFPELDQYTIFSYDRFTGEVDTQALERALLQAARDTEAFRLRLGETDGTPYQWLDTDAEFEARHVGRRAILAARRLPPRLPAGRPQPGGPGPAA